MESGKIQVWLDEPDIFDRVLDCRFRAKVRTAKTVIHWEFLSASELKEVSQVQWLHLTARLLFLLIQVVVGAIVAFF